MALHKCPKCSARKVTKKSLSDHLSSNHGMSDSTIQNFFIAGYDAGISNASYDSSCSDSSSNSSSYDSSSSSSDGGSCSSDGGGGY